MSALCSVGFAVGLGGGVNGGCAWGAAVAVGAGEAAAAVGAGAGAGAGAAAGVCAAVAAGGAVAPGVAGLGVSGCDESEVLTTHPVVGSAVSNANQRIYRFMSILRSRVSPIPCASRKSSEHSSQG